MKKPDSIRARMTLAFSFSLALLLFLACAALILYAHGDAERNARQTLSTAVHKVRNEIPNGEGQWKLSELLEEERDLAGDNLAVLVINKQGRVTQKSQNHGPSWPPIPEEGWRLATVPAGSDTIVIGLPWKKTEQTLTRQALFLSLLSLLVIVCGSLGAWVLVGRTLSPIGRLTQQAREASIQNLSISLTAPSRDAEIVGLVGTLNDLLLHVTEVTAAQGRFYAAASHELRTPLQALSGHLELALRRPRNQQEYFKVVEEAYTQTRRLTLLIRDLLLLNQLETASLPAYEPVDIVEICERSLRHFDALLTTRRLTVQTEIPLEAFVQAPPMHVEMLLRNLIENACKYADEGGYVRVQVVMEAGQAHLHLFNTCVAGPDDDMEKLYEPFYRPDASRNSETGGNGLGLAICKAIADVNGWQLRLQREADGILASVVFTAQV